MNLHRQVDYAIRCVTYLSGTRERLATKTEIAQAVRAPDLFVAKILQKLVRSGLVASTRGVRGGFALASDPSKLSVLDVMDVAQEPAAPRPCVLNPRACDFRADCPMHPVWVRIHQSTMRELKKTTIASLAQASKAPTKLSRQSRRGPGSKPRSRAKT
jgi:Rrf2 family protein